MAVVPKYFYVGESPKDVFFWSFENPLFPNPSRDEKDTGLISNPIFNFNNNFIKNLEKIRNDQLGLAVPYISLKMIKGEGKEVVDLNLEFFQKNIDMDGIRESNKRYPERPVMSLKDVEIKTDLSSGYIYYTLVSLNFKIHSPYALQEGVLLGLLIPGMPLMLEYGWNAPHNADPNGFLTKKEKILLAVKSYTIDISNTGEVDLSVEAMAFNENFNNVLVGDEESVKSEDGVWKSFQKMQEALKITRDKELNSVANVELKKAIADRYETNEKKARGEVAKRFKNNKEILKKNALFSKKVGTKPIKFVTFHDLIYALCHKTFENISNLYYGIDELRIIYGRFNETAGTFKNRSIADFPVNFKKIDDKLSVNVGQGDFIPSVQGLLNIVIGDFIENPEYFKSFLSDREKKYVAPDVVINVSNRTEKNGKEEKNVMEVAIIDANTGIPSTTNEVLKLSESRSKVSYQDLENAIIGETDIPIIRLGHSNSFIKNTSLSHITDEFIRAVLIERMYKDRIGGVRDQDPPAENSEARFTNPLILPLRGSLHLLGHVNWKPFRAFYLDAGIYLINAVYKITGVTHRLSAEGFDTEVDIIYH